MLKDTAKQLLSRIGRMRRRTSAHRLRHRKVWLLGLAVFLTSVTIAAIIPRGDSIQLGANGPTTPPQIVQLGDEVRKIPAAPAFAADTAPSQPRPESDPARWTVVSIRKGDTLSDILQREGHDGNPIYRAIHANPEARVFRQLYPGQKLRLRTDADGRLRELVYESDPGEAYHLQRRDDHYELSKEIRNFDTRVAYVVGRIESSLFEDGLDAGLSEPLIMKLVEIFGWDVDFALDLRRGDSFAVIHEERYWQGQKVADGPILAAEFVNQGRVFRAIAFRDANGYLSYYTPDGVSVRRPFLRTPVEFSRITSRFTNRRYHPVLKTWRAHKGVDYAAPTGTPVRATASGRIVALGRHGGYGNRIVIRHNATYSTVYAHLSRYHPKLRVGSFVDQGQTIGYVGATGLASGPHLHYEFQVNGEHRNPLTFKFSGGGKIAEQYRDEFTRRARSWSAQLDVIGHDVRLVANR